MGERLSVAAGEAWLSQEAALFRTIIIVSVSHLSLILEGRAESLALFKAMKRPPSGQGVKVDEYYGHLLPKQLLDKREMHGTQFTV